MAQIYNTPGVYINESSHFPASVQGAVTALPVFIGITTRCDDEVKATPVKIHSLMEYDQAFEWAESADRIAVQNADGEFSLQVLADGKYVKPMPKSVMYHNIRLFFENGGSECYVYSVGSQPQDLTEAAAQTAFSHLESKLDITLLVLSDFAYYLTQYDVDGNWIEDGDALLYSIYSQALTHCQTMQNRITIVDAHYASQGESIDSFRNTIGINALEYGATYTPFLITHYPFSYYSEKVRFSESGQAIIGNTLALNTEQFFCTVTQLSLSTGDSVTDFSISDNLLMFPNDANDVPTLLTKWSSFADSTGMTLQPVMPETTLALNGANTFFEEASIKVAKNGDATFEVGSTLILQQGATGIEFSYNEGTYTLTFTFFAHCTAEQLVAEFARQQTEGLLSEEVEALDLVVSVSAVDSRTVNIPAIQDIEFNWKNLSELPSQSMTAAYQEIMDLASARTQVHFPPAGTMAGVYASIDRNRGVWQSPANVSLNGVLEPAVQLSAKQQEPLNVDATSGKSINAIRSFPAKGTLVWGARTLAGNDNNWRYIGVRRLFCYVEQSLQLALNSFVFEPNTAITWLKVKATVIPFLEDLWKQGALVGSKEQDAFFVDIGLGTTMTNQDILEGRMNVNIGLAASRPAEFIVVEFSQLLQQ